MRKDVWLYAEEDHLIRVACKCPTFAFCSDLLNLCFHRAYLTQAHEHVEWDFDHERGWFQACKVKAAFGRLRWKQCSIGKKVDWSWLIRANEHFSSLDRERWFVLNYTCDLVETEARDAIWTQFSEQKVVFSLKFDNWGIGVAETFLVSLDFIDRLSKLLAYCHR